MPTTPSPFKYNRTRYAKVSKRAKSGKSGCVVIAFIIALGAPSAIATPLIALFT